MKLIIIRHGETLGNVNNYPEGQSDGELSPLGIQQAKKLAKRLQKTPIDIAYCSDLGRAVDTAKIILEYHPDLHLHLDQRIRERYFGELENKVYPGTFGWVDLPECVEKNESVSLRVEDFFDDIFHKHSNKTVLVVCHGGTKSGFLNVIHNKPYHDFEVWGDIGNTSVTEIDVFPDKSFRVYYIGNTKHLE